MPEKPLRIVTFNILPIAYQVLTRWINENGHKHILAVTTPGPTTRPTATYTGVVEAAPRNVDVLVTTRLRNVATPLIRTLEPDLIMCFSFPYRLTLELISIPKIGAVNLHPAVLPAYRGPNVFRMFYEGWHEYGVTIHWMDADFDTGNILSQARAPLPQEIDPEAIFENWVKIGYEALEEGMAKAIAGNPGTQQDDSEATYAAPYTEEEKWLDWNEPRRIIQLKHMGLVGEAKATINDEAYSIKSIQAIPQQELSGEPGQILDRNDNTYIIQSGDDAILVEVETLSE